MLRLSSFACVWVCCLVLCCGLLVWLLVCSFAFPLLFLAVDWVCWLLVVCLLLFVDCFVVVAVTVA